MKILTFNIPSYNEIPDLPTPEIYHVATCASGKWSMICTSSGRFCKNSSMNCNKNIYSSNSLKKICHKKHEIFVPLPVYNIVEWLSKPDDISD